MGLIGLCQALLSQEKTIKLKVPEGYDEITYDASQTTPQELDYWLTLSPVISQNNGYLVPENPLLCNIDDRAYTGCGHEQVSLNRGNAKRNQEKIQERLERLSVTQFPSEFEPIVSYFRAVQAFGLWRNQQEIDYFENRNFDSLGKPYESLGIDPKVACSGVLQRIRTLSDPARAWNLVVNDWQNCMWREAVKAIGEYPKQAWDAALKAKGIREHLVLQEN